MIQIKLIQTYTFSVDSKLQYNTVKPKTVKPNLLDEPKDKSCWNFSFFYLCFFKSETQNLSKTVDPLRFGLTT